MVHIFNFIRSIEYVNHKIEYVNHKIARTIIHKHTVCIVVEFFIFFPL